jgi:Flp pilus assembly protein TadG
MTRTRPPHPDRSEQGSSTIELVLLTPVLLALLFGLVQAALLWEARHVVGVAAQHGARLARTATALQPAGTDSAADGPGSDQAVQVSTLAYLKQVGGTSLNKVHVDVQRRAGYVTVTVTGTAIGVLPGTTVQVSGSSRTPEERFQPDLRAFTISEGSGSSNSSAGGSR